MPVFSTLSKSRLAECDPRIQRLFGEVIKFRDCAVLCGFRGQAEQDRAYTSGASDKPWPTGRHNRKPSLAVDVAPYPIENQDRERAILFAGFVLGIATAIGIRIRWGGDWNGDGHLHDHQLSDLYHFEIPA